MLQARLIIIAHTLLILFDYSYQQSIFPLDFGDVKPRLSACEPIMNKRTNIEMQTHLITIIIDIGGK